MGRFVHPGRFSGFEVQGLGFRVSGLGITAEDGPFRAPGSLAAPGDDVRVRPGVSGLGFGLRVQGLGFGVCNQSE
ncbi:hypothetical protein T484DRAFT_2825605 [Baffinella frigidus]|nr:hypothetical protein T484DRAFT_2825605 [Cryptophyta sp. CCMP2293]